MSRTTIDFGIDLGTTNSAIAVLKGVKAEVIKSNLDTDITPSAVYIGRAGNVIVGSKAKSKLEDDRSAEDAYIEFKRRMGDDSMYTFHSSGIKKSPEELSSEVLKSLKGNVQQRLDEDIKAAVITIPAAFAAGQCVATKKAAELAGFSQCPLLQEPVAASLAYGFQTNTDRRSFWLVFDFGGGTFDAAVMKAEDGDIQVVNHGGNNFLGGADIDWGIIERIIIPQIKDSYNLPNFTRDNSQWRSAFAKIKRAVEEAKINLSRSPDALLDGCIFEDADGNEIELDGFKLTQNQMIEIVEPLIDRAVDKCKSVLAEKNLSPSAIEKTILVGGPTLAPYFRNILADKLGIPLDHSVDPLTVVAQGAAVFAGTQRIDRATRGASVPTAAGVYKVTLNYQPIGPDDDPAVVGEVVPPAGASVSGCAIEFTNRTTRWSSGAIPLNSEGKFHLRLRAESGDQNIFDIKLTDSTGERIPTDTKEIPYTIGVSIKAQITCNDISIELADNKVELLVPKGTAYPFKKTNRKFTTVVELKKGQSGKIVIPVLEAYGGDAGRLADHNGHLGDLVITSDNLRRDLPLGSEIEITLSAKEPGALRVEAYVPLLDESFTAHLEYLRKLANTEEGLRSEFSREKSRARDIIERANAEDSEVEKKIDTLMSEVASLWNAAGSVEGAAQIQQRIVQIRIELDNLEESAKFPEKVEDIRGRFDDIEQYDSEMTSAQRKELAAFKQRLDEIESRHDIAELERFKNEVLDLWRDVYVDRYDFWAGNLAYLYKTRNRLPSSDEVTRLFEQGARAMQNKDKEAVRRCVVRLWDLSPVDVVEESKRGHGAGITI